MQYWILKFHVTKITIFIRITFHEICRSDKVIRCTDKITFCKCNKFFRNITKAIGSFKICNPYKISIAAVCWLNNIFVDLTKNELLSISWQSFSQVWQKRLSGSVLSDQKSKSPNGATFKDEPLCEDNRPMTRGGSSPHPATHPVKFA